MVLIAYAECITATIFAVHPLDGTGRLTGGMWPRDLWRWRNLRIISILGLRYLLVERNVKKFNLIIF